MYFWLTLLLLIDPIFVLSKLDDTLFFPMVKKAGQRRRRLEADNEAANFWDVKDHPDHSAIEGADYFYAVIQLGTPPKSFDMILDTGSHLTYVPCAHTCKTCGPNHHHKKYNKDDSSSYSKLGCSDSKCKEAKFSCRKEECSFSISYMEGSSVHGIYMNEILTLGHEKNKKEIPVAVGCIESETKLIYGQDADGIMGLGDSPVSILNQFHDYGLPFSFGICFGSDNEGVMTFGSYHPPEIQFTNMITKGSRESYFKVKVKQILIGGVALDVPTSAYGASSLIDTGSSDTLIPRKVFSAFKAIMGKTVKGALKKERDGNLCFRNSNTKEMYASIPELVIVLDNDIRITAPFPNLIYKKQKTYICTTVFEHYGQMIIGGNTMMDHFIFLDRANKRVGVARHNCKDLKQKMYADSGAAAPTVLDVEEETTNTKAPILAKKTDPIPAGKKDSSISQLIEELKPDANIISETKDTKQRLAAVKKETSISSSMEDLPRLAEEQPDTWITWEFLAMFVIMVTFCAYAIYNTPGAKHHYTQVATDDMTEEAFAELNEVEIADNSQDVEDKVN